MREGGLNSRGRWHYVIKVMQFLSVSPGRLTLGCSLLQCSEPAQPQEEATCRCSGWGLDETSLCQTRDGGWLDRVLIYKRSKWGDFLGVLDLFCILYVDVKLHKTICQKNVNVSSWKHLFHILLTYLEGKWMWHELELPNAPDLIFI